MVYLFLFIAYLRSVFLEFRPVDFLVMYFCFLFLIQFMINQSISHFLLFFSIRLRSKWFLFWWNNFFNTFCLHFTLIFFIFVLQINKDSVFDCYFIRRSINSNTDFRKAKEAGVSKVYLIKFGKLQNLFILNTTPPHKTDPQVI